MDPDCVAEKLEKYGLQLRQVEAALETDPSHPELLKLKQDLNELIEMTKSIVHGQASGTSEKPSSNGKPPPFTLFNDSGVGPLWRTRKTLKVKKLLEDVAKLSDEEYETFMIDNLDAFREDKRPLNLLHAIVHRYVEQKKDLAERSNKPTAESIRRNQVVECILPKLNPVGLKDVPLVCRSDLMDGPLFLSVGKVRVKKNNADGFGLCPGAVAIVNANDVLVFWSWIWWPEHDILSTFPKMTGLTPDSLKIGVSLDTVTTLLRPLTSTLNVTIVGHQLNEDLAHLQITPKKTEDITDYFRTDDGYCYPLKNLKCLIEAREENSGSTPLVDSARAVGRLYKWIKYYEADFPKFSAHPSYSQVKGKYDGMTETELFEIPDEDLKDPEIWHGEIRQANIPRKLINSLVKKRNMLIRGSTRVTSMQKRKRKFPPDVIELN